MKPCRVAGIKKFVISTNKFFWGMLRHSTLLGVLLLLSVVNAQGIYTWIGGSICNTGNVWSSNSSSICWSPNGIPGSMDTIIFPSGTSTTVKGNEYENQYLNNFDSSTHVYGVATTAQYDEVIVQGSLTINSSMIIVTTGGFYIALGATVQTQGYLSGIDGTGTLSVQGTLLMTAGALFGTGQTVISAGGLLNITTILVNDNYINATEIFLLRDINIYGTVLLSDHAS